MSDSSVGQQGPGSATCGIDAFLVSESNYVLEDVCFHPAPWFCLIVNIVDKVLLLFMDLKTETHAEL